jgi:hypothetical protein
MMNHQHPTSEILYYTAIGMTKDERHASFERAMGKIENADPMEAGALNGDMTDFQLGDIHDFGPKAAMELAGCLGLYLAAHPEVME